jgi:phage/plasmid-associated DNA primase
VSKATKEYRDEMDLAQRFIEEECTVGSKVDYREKFSTLYDRWEYWRKGKGGVAYSKIAFGKKLDSLGYPGFESSGNWRLGLRLHTRLET